MRMRPDQPDHQSEPRPTRHERRQLPLDPGPVPLAGLELLGQHGHEDHVDEEAGGQALDDRRGEHGPEVILENGS